MKTLKAICTAAVLALVLTVTAYAGDIHTPGLTGDISTPGVTQPPATVPGDICSTGMESPATEDVGISELTAILLTLAALF
jgi:hypothetical protein